MLQRFTLSLISPLLQDTTPSTHPRTELGGWRQRSVIGYIFNSSTAGEDPPCHQPRSENPIPARGIIIKYKSKRSILHSLQMKRSVGSSR